MRAVGSVNPDDTTPFQTGYIAIAEVYTMIISCQVAIFGVSEDGCAFVSDSGFPGGDASIMGQHAPTAQYYTEKAK